jgi:hypothetical protein
LWVIKIKDDRIMIGKMMKFKPLSISLRVLSVVAIMTVGSMAFAVAPVPPVSITQEFGDTGYSYTLEVTSAPEAAGTAWVHDNKIYVQKDKEYTFRLTANEDGGWYVGMQPRLDDGTLDYARRNGSRDGAGPNTTYIYNKRTFSTCGAHSIAKGLFYKGTSFRHADMNPVEIEVYIIKVDLDGDFNHDGNIDSSDPDDDEEHTAPGLLVPLNEDDDDNNNTADKDDSSVTGEDDLIKVHLGLLPDSVDEGLVIFAAIHPGNAGDIKVWSSPTKGAGNLIIDTTNPTPPDPIFKKEWTLSSSFTFGDIPEDLYVEGFHASSNGQVRLLLRYQNPVGTTICEDEILITVIVPELDVGETARPANRIGWDDPRAVDTAVNKIVMWSTDLDADKTHLDVLKYPDIAGVYYRLSQRWPFWNSGYPVESLLTANSQSYNPVHDPWDADWDFKVHYGPTASERDKYGPYEVYVVSDDDYIEARGVVYSCLVPLAHWSEALYEQFRNGGAWPASGLLYQPTSISGTVSFKTDQDHVGYADLTHKFGATITVDAPVVISGRRYPSSTATVPVYYWDALSNVNDLFRTDSRVETVVKAFLKKIPYAELYSLYSTAPVAPSGIGRVVRWEFSMAPHHKLYWSSKPSESLTGGDDSLLYTWGILPWIVDAEPLGALGDVWVVGSDPAQQLYGGSGYIDLTVEELASLDLKIHKLPVINMTVEDLFDFDYFGSIPARSAASIQCAHGRKAAGIGQVKLLRFDVLGEVSNMGNNIIIPKP